MDIEFRMQDPTDPDTQYMFEAVVSAASGATSWRGMYAFATRGGVDQLLGDPAFVSFLERGGTIELIVGIDAVTNRNTLERMQDIALHTPNFNPLVFWNSQRGLFHPKISLFNYPDGRRRLIVGSGNLTPGGLRNNFEAYSVLTAAADDFLNLESLDEFLARHAVDIRRIDQAALERAALNFVRPVAGVVRPRAPIVVQPRTVIPGAVAAVVVPNATFNRVLVAEVPAAGGRWSQVHFNREIIDQFFRVSNVAVQRVYLTRVDPAGERGDEEVRPVVYSLANRNHKIEMAAAKGLDYPGAGPPILVYWERQIRSFDYLLLLPGSEGYTQLAALLGILPTIGKGMRRAITDIATLARTWASCPLLIEPVEPMGADL